MEAPVPASALIHSATLVSAGIFLCVKTYSTLKKYPFVLEYLKISGLLSAVVFSVLASLQTDKKRLLAFSTISNCGFIYFLLGGFLLPEACLYFTTHGILKSYTFLVFGTFIVHSKHIQDMQK